MFCMDLPAVLQALPSISEVDTPWPLDWTPEELPEAQQVNPCKTGPLAVKISGNGTRCTDPLCYDCRASRCQLGLCAGAHFHGYHHLDCYVSLYLTALCAGAHFRHRCRCDSLVCHCQFGLCASAQCRLATTHIAIQAMIIVIMCASAQFKLVKTHMTIQAMIIVIMCASAQ